MINYGNTKPTPRKRVTYNDFLSVDFSKAPSNVKPYYSPNSLNMIRDEYGKVRRRLGYTLFKGGLGGKVYGITRFKTSLLCHTKNLLIDLNRSSADNVIYTGMNEAKSSFFYYNEKMYILDGKNFLEYDGSTCKAVEGKIPLIMISCKSNGAGVPFEQVNLLQDKFEQSYKTEEGVADYHLAFQKLSSAPVTAKQVTKEGTKTLVENKDFTVNRDTGVVHFNTIIGADPFVEDNLFITASKDRSEQRNKVLQCTFFKGFGENGYENQIFATGNDKFKSYVFWSDANDVTYWGDLQYAILGQDNSAVNSLSAIENKLIAYKDEVSGQTYVCSVSLQPINELYVPQITVDRVITGAGCIAPGSVQSFGEPLFLSTLGIQAVTYRDLSTQEIETIRGDRVNRKLLLEPNIENAISCVYKYFYLLALNGNVYVLDRLNPQGEANVINNNYQYNAFFWDDVPATCFFVDNNDLYFGTENGEIMKFYTDENESQSYNDNGKTYNWLWEFPEYVGDSFYSNKAIKYVALRAKAYVRTSVEIDVQLQGLWYNVIKDNTSFGYLDLSDLDLNALNLSTDATPKKTTEKYTERKLDKFAFRVKGNAINEPFGLYAFAFEVKERGKHKG